jgi:hypothetical protein
VPKELRRVSRQLNVQVSGRIAGRIDRLAHESELSRDEAVQKLLSNDRIDRVLALRPYLVLWGHRPGTRPRPLSARVSTETYKRLREAVEDLNEEQELVTISDLVRYLLAGGRTPEEMDEDWRSTEPLAP